MKTPLTKQEKIEALKVIGFVWFFNISFGILCRLCRALYYRTYLFVNVNP